MSSSQSDRLSVIKPSTSKYSRPGFLTIAGELRNRIYELSLLQDKQVYPFDYKPCGGDCPKDRRHAPAVALLCVNRQIHREATPLLYANVTPHLSTGFMFVKFMGLGEMFMHGSPVERDIYPSRHLIRSLRIKFVPEHMPSEIRPGQVQDCWADFNFARLPRRKRTQVLHQYQREVCEAVWTNAGKVINIMRALKSLTIDFSQVFCPLGCCRNVGHVLKSLKELRKKTVFSMKITGELQLGERRQILVWLNYGFQALEFGPLVYAFLKEEEEENEEESEEEDDDDDEHYVYDDDEEEEEEEEEEYEDEDEEIDYAALFNASSEGSHSGESEDDKPLDEEIDDAAILKPSSEGSHAGKNEDDKPLNEENDPAGMFSASTAGSHSGGSEDSLETSDTEPTEAQIAAAFRLAPLGTY